MRITWVTRSFLDYRIPVFAEVNRLCGDQLTVIYDKEVESDGLIRKIESVLGPRAIGLTGEFRLGGKKMENAQFANSGIRIPFQPGLMKQLRMTGPEVMLSDGFMQWTYAPLLFRMFHRVPHVMCYERTPFTERHCQWYRRAYRKFVLHWIDAVCANGKLCGEYLKSLGLTESRIFYGQMAADTEGLAKAAAAISDDSVRELRSRFPVKGPMFLYVGQIIPRKGIRQLLQSWRKTDFSHVGLLLIGDGSEREELQRWCHENHLKNIFWLGKQPYDEIARFYRIADIFIIPTLEDNWSLVVPEAMACGLPIACSIYNGCHPELVHPENGWTFDPLDPEATAAMLGKIVKQKEGLKKMGEESRRIILDHTPQKAAENIYNTCRKVVDVK
ncbi:MAG: glycosyltransferase family 4 protein [Lentisphaeria bacterium]|nr:glycosyltransferase family 4 protein [Lentisphaeria bacterium]